MSHKTLPSAVINGGRSWTRFGILNTNCCKCQGHHNQFPKSEPPPLCIFIYRADAKARSSVLSPGDVFLLWIKSHNNSWVDFSHHLRTMALNPSDYSNYNLHHLICNSSMCTWTKINDKLLTKNKPHFQKSALTCIASARISLVATFYPLRMGLHQGNTANILNGAAGTTRQCTVYLEKSRKKRSLIKPAHERFIVRQHFFLFC